MEKLDMRSEVAILTAYANNLCNAKTEEEVNQAFLHLKDQVIKIYKHNIERVSK